MTNADLAVVAAIVLGAIGTYLLLPHRHGRIKPRSAHIAGGVLAALGVLLLAMTWTRPSEILQAAFFYGFALAAIGGGIMTITSRSPVYSALWFAAVVLSTSGLFLLAGAQFLAAGTVIVYAGAIIVTFLFVIMLAQAGGRAAYDRTARAPARATLSCFLLLWSLAYALLHVSSTADQVGSHPIPVEQRFVPAWGLRTALPQPEARAVLDRAVPETNRLGPAALPHVAGLGGTLYADFLLAVEVAGAILFVALVGAAVIASPKAPVRPRPGGGDPAQLREQMAAR